jgi:general secretion pathway protein B
VSRTEPSLADAAATSSAGTEPLTSAAAPRQVNLPDDAASLRSPDPASLNLPSAAALAAQGIAVPPLRLELHAYSERPRDRFVFINGRKYAEGDVLAEGPQVVSIEPTGVVLAHSGRRFVLVQE